MQTNIERYKMFKLLGFTLAEVLITLGIIGVVATLTIPPLINNYQKTQYLTLLKKDYSQFQQALLELAVDEGCIGDLSCTSVFDGHGPNNAATSLANYTTFISYFKIAKDCYKVSNQGCFTHALSPSSEPI